MIYSHSHQVWNKMVQHSDRDNLVPEFDPTMISATQRVLIWRQARVQLESNFLGQKMLFLEMRHKNLGSVESEQAECTLPGNLPIFSLLLHFKVGESFQGASVPFSKLEVPKCWTSTVLQLCLTCVRYFQSPDWFGLVFIFLQIPDLMFLPLQFHQFVVVLQTYA